MKCSEAQNYMMRYLDKELNAFEENHLEEHIETCEICSEEFAGLKEIFAGIENDLTVIEPPEDFELQVMNRIRNETEMYGKISENGKYVFNVLLATVSFIFVILFGGVLWEVLNHPISLIQNGMMVSELAKELYTSAITMLKGMCIAVMGVAASIYTTYYYAYILLGVLLLLIQRVFFKMVRAGNGGAQ